MVRKGTLRKQDVSGLIDDIALFRDLEEDVESFLGESERTILIEKLLDLETGAIDLLFREWEIQEGTARIKIVIIGDFSAGKSAFINSVIGKSICPVDACPTTSSITRISYGDNPIIIRMDTGKKVSQEEYEILVRDSGNGKPKENVQSFEYYFPSDFLRNMVLVDTPGFANVKNPKDTILTEEETKDADVIFLIVDMIKGGGGIAADILKTVKKIREYSPDTEWWLVLNKAERISPKGRIKILEDIKNYDGGAFKEIFLYSSLKISEDPLGILFSEYKRMGQRVREYVNNRSTFNFKIEGGHEESDYRISVNGITCRFPDRKDVDISNRHDLSQRIEELSYRKSELLKASAKRNARVWQTRRNHVLRDILSDIRLRFGNHKNGSFDSLVQDRVDVLKREIEKELQFMVRSIIRNAFDLSTCKIKRTLFPDGSYVRITYKETATYDEYNNSTSWGRISELIEEFIGDINKDHSIVIDINEVWSIVKKAKRSVLDSLDARLKSIRPDDHYDNLKMARDEINKIVFSDEVKVIESEMAEKGGDNIICGFKGMVFLKCGEIQGRENVYKEKIGHVIGLIVKAINNKKGKMLE